MFPRAKKANPDADASIKIETSYEPDTIDAIWWSRKTAGRRARGEGRELRFEWRPVVQDDVVTAIRLEFDLPGRPNRFLLRVAGTWRDQEGLDEMQNASWMFHLRLRR